MKLIIPRIASLVRPTQVCSQDLENLTYMANKKTLIQYDMEVAQEAPLLPSPELYTKIQHTRMWNKVVIPEHINIGQIIFWVCKNLTWH